MKVQPSAAHLARSVSRVFSHSARRAAATVPGSSDSCSFQPIMVLAEKMEISKRSMSFTWALFTSSLPFLSMHSLMMRTVSSGLFSTSMSCAAFLASKSMRGSSSLMLVRPKEMFL